MCFCEKHRFIRTKYNSPPINGQCTNFLFHILNTVSGTITYDSNVNNNSRYWEGGSGDGGWFASFTLFALLNTGLISVCYDC